MKLRHDLVYVEWDDAATLALGWQQDHEIHPQAQIAHTVGFLVKRTAGHYVVSSTLDDELSSNHHFQIPRRMVRLLVVIARRGKMIETLWTPVIPEPT